MLLRGQMVRVPVTAAQKFGEAVYFYNKGMLPHRTNPAVFPYYLSAFVSALRSITFYMQKQYGHNPEFEKWYEEKQQAMTADPVLTLLNEKRRTAIHIEPFDLCFTKTFKMPEKYGGVIETKFLELREEPDGEGRVRMYLTVGKDGIEEEVEPEMTWHFTEDDPEDVMNHCHHGLKKMDVMLKELAGLGLKQG